MEINVHGGTESGRGDGCDQQTQDGLGVVPGTPDFGDDVRPMAGTGAGGDEGSTG